MLQRIEWTTSHVEVGGFPQLGDNTTGEWETFENPNWTGGFWVGMLWLAYEKTGEKKYLQWARSWNDAILGYELEDNHDRGFVYFYSSVFGYRMILDERYFDSAFEAAHKLVDMFQPQSRAIPQNLDTPEDIIIDTIMNLQLLWWAYAYADETDPYRDVYLEVAIAQATTTLNDFVRQDGSTWQSVHYDLATGKIVRKHTHQGYTDSSCWSRGQSWGFYGFVKAYETTKKIHFLNAAKILGEYIITHVPEDGVPWYDYDDPGKYRDTSAGAIAAAGFLQLSKVVTDSASKERYQSIGRKMVKDLVQGHLTPFVDKDSSPGILRNGCYQIFKNADSETIWGDYYLMEALAQVLFSKE